MYRRTRRRRPDDARSPQRARHQDEGCMQRPRSQQLAAQPRLQHWPRGRRLGGRGGWFRASSGGLLDFEVKDIVCEAERCGHVIHPKFRDSFLDALSDARNLESEPQSPRLRDQPFDRRGARERELRSDNVEFVMRQALVARSLVVTRHRLLGFLALRPFCPRRKDLTATAARPKNLHAVSTSDVAAGQIAADDADHLNLFSSIHFPDAVPDKEAHLVILRRLDQRLGRFHRPMALVGFLEEVACSLASLPCGGAALSELKDSGVGMLGCLRQSSGVCPHGGVGHWGYSLRMLLSTVYVDTLA